MSSFYFNLLLGIMSAVGLAVFISLYFVKAGYGVFRSKSWGFAIPNKWGWVLMEVPVFLIMLILCLYSERRFETVPFLFFLFFQIHYFNRSFIFPFLLKGKSKMPLSVVFMGVFFNVFNGFIQGYWIFYLAPNDLYTLSWLKTPQFIGGTLIFFLGMGINLHSDRIIRKLRKAGDNQHHFPKGGLYNRVTSANYFGEIVEWGGFALLTWSLSGMVFFWWTCANLVPRAHAIYNNYKLKFPEEIKGHKRIFPFIY